MTDEEYARIPEPFRSVRYIKWVIKHKGVEAHRANSKRRAWWVTPRNWMRLNYAYHLEEDMIQECLIAGVGAHKTYKPNRGSTSNWAAWAFQSAIGVFIRKYESFYRLKPVYGQYLGPKDVIVDDLERDDDHREKPMAFQRRTRLDGIQKALSDDGGIREKEKEMFAQWITGEYLPFLAKDGVGRLTGSGERQLAVIRYRFGFTTGWSMTLKQVGDKFGVTRERIRQIEARAMKMLKRSERVNQLLGK